VHDLRNVECNCSVFHNFDYLQATKQSIQISLVLGVAVDPICLTAVGHLFQLKIFLDSSIVCEFCVASSRIGKLKLGRF
jgi:hypothetical protein